MEVCRIENGQIEEFWGTFQAEAAPALALNTNALFPIRGKQPSFALLATAVRA